MARKPPHSLTHTSDSLPGLYLRAVLLSVQPKAAARQTQTGTENRGSLFILVIYPIITLNIQIFQTHLLQCIVVKIKL